MLAMRRTGCSCAASGGAANPSAARARQVIRRNLIAEKMYRDYIASSSLVPTPRPSIRNADASLPAVDGRTAVQILPAPIGRMEQGVERRAPRPPARHPRRRVLDVRGVGAPRRRARVGAVLHRRREIGGES